MALTATQVQQLYIAYYGRPADPAGLSGWKGSDFTTAQKAFIAGKEFANLYGTSTPTEQVTKVYQNLLGRAPDAEGLKYWAGQLTVDTNKFGELVFSMLNNALGKDKTTIDNRIKYAEQFTNSVNTIEEINAYNGPAATQAAREALSAVTATAAGDDASLNAALAAVDATIIKIVSGGSAASSTFTLTAGAAAVVEGASVEFTLVSTVAATVDQTFNVVIKGDTLNDTPGVSAADSNDFVVQQVTLPAGKTSVTFTLTPKADNKVEGNEGFKVVLTDASFIKPGALATSGAVVISDNTNTAPVLVATQDVAATEDTAVTINAVATDAEKDKLTYTTTEAANGTVTGKDGAYTYTPKANFHGADSFTVTVDDGQGGKVTQTVNVTVASVNDVPVIAAAAQAVTTAEDTATASITVAATDVDGDTLTYTAGTAANGTVKAGATAGTFVYTPNLNFNGADSFVVTAADGQGGEAKQTVNVTITPVNDAPTVAATQEVAGTEDKPVNVTVTAVDPEGDAMTYTAGAAANGTVVAGTAAGTFVYTPKADFNGADSFEVTVKDAAGLSSVQTVKVTLASVLDYKVTADAATVDEGKTVKFAITDAAPNTQLTYQLSGKGIEINDVVGRQLTGVVTTDAKGEAAVSIAIDTDSLTEGVEELTFALLGRTESAATTKVSINDTTIANAAPVATAVTAKADEAGAAVTGKLAATDANTADVLVYSAVKAVEGLTINADGTFSFDATKNTAASALKYSDAPLEITADYSVTDGKAAATSTLKITVTPTPLTFKMAPTGTTAQEGVVTTFTLTASEALTAAKNVVFTVVPSSLGSTTPVTNADTVFTNNSDFESFALTPTTVAMAVGATVAKFDVRPFADKISEAPEAFKVEAVVDGDTTVYTVSNKVIDGVSTTGINIPLTTSATDNIKGDAGNDTIIGQLGQTTTLQASDVIDGGDGTADVLRVVTDSTVALPAQSVSGFTSTNVEILEVQAQATGGTTLGLENVTGLTTVRQSSSNGALTLNNVKNIVGLESKNTLGAASSVTVNYAAAAVSGSADTQTLKLENDTVGTVTVNGIETIAITTATGASTVKGLTGDALKTVTVAGDQALTFGTALPGAVTSVDASNQTAGGITLSLTNAGNVAVKGGVGSDTVTFTGAFTGADSFDGGDGAGRDTIIANMAEYTASSYAAAAKISKVEVVTFADKLSADFDAGKITGEDTFTLAAGFATSTLSNVTAGTTLNLNAANAGQTLTVTGATSLNLVLNSATAPADALGDFGTIAATAATTLTVASNGVNVATDATKTVANTLALTAAAAAKVTVTGVEDLTLSLTGTALKELDAGNSSGGNNFSGVAFAATGAVIKGGSGVDVIVGSAGTDVITGGIGADFITGAAGADLMTGGDGVDTYIYKAVTDSFGTTADTITDFVSGTDVLNLSAVATAMGRATVVLKAGSAADFGSAQAAILQNSGVTQVVYQFDTKTLWVDLNDDGTLNNNDLQIKLTGVSAVVAADVAGTGTGTGVGGGTGPVVPGPGGTTTAAVAVAAAGSVTDGGATVNTTYTVAAGGYTYNIAGFGIGDVLKLFAGAALTVMPDADQTDGAQSITAADAASGATTTITLTGLTAAQDGALFNVASFATVFGAGTIV